MTSLFTDETNSSSSSSREQENSKYNWTHAFVEDSGQPVFMEAFDWKDPEQIESAIWELVSVDNEIDNKKNEIKKIQNSIQNNKGNNFDVLLKIAKLRNDIEWLNVIQTDAKIDSKSGGVVSDERTVNNILGDWYIRKTGKEASDIRKQFYNQLYNNFNNMEISQQSVLSPARPRILSKDESESSQEDKEVIKKNTIKKLKNTVKNVMKTNAALKRLQDKNRDWRQTSKDNLTSLFHSDSSQDSDNKDSQDANIKSPPKKKSRRVVNFGESRTVGFDTELAPKEIQRTLSLGSESRKAFQDDFITREELEGYEEILSNASVVSDEADKLFRDADLLTSFPTLSPFPMYQTQNTTESLPDFKLPPSKVKKDSKKSIYETYSDDEQYDDEAYSMLYNFQKQSGDDDDKTHPFFLERQSPTASIIPTSPFSAFKNPLSSPRTIKRKRLKPKAEEKKMQSKRLELDVKSNNDENNNDDKKKRKRPGKGGKKKKTKKKSKKKKKKTRRKR